MPFFLLIIVVCVGCAHQSFDEIVPGDSLDAEVAQNPDVRSVEMDSDLVNDAGVVDVGTNGDATLDLDAQRVEDFGHDGGHNPTRDALVSVDAEQLMLDAAAEMPDAHMETPDAMVPMPDMMIPEPSTGYTLCGVGMTSRVGRGTWADPIRIGRFPFLDRFNTATEGESRIDTYDCAETTGEFGREVVYAFELEAPGDLTAMVRDDGAGADIDLHLLRDYTENGRTISGCIGRAHTRLVAERLDPGRYLLVADSWSNAQGVAYEGAYDLAIDIVEHRVWRDIPLTENIRWSRFRGIVEGSWQSINVLTLSPSAIESMQLGAHAGCKTVIQEVGVRDAVAGVNAGYFTGGCGDKGFLRIADTTVSTSLATTSEPPLPTEARVGWRGQDVWFEWGASGSDWTQPAHALGAHPMLVQNGMAQAQVQNGEQVYSSIDWGPQPRTAFAYTDQGEVLLLTLDGRTSAGAGFSTPALAAWLGATFNLTGALNLDGGGSTTFAVNDCWVGSEYGIWGSRAFNSPSDNDQADENGARGVSSGIYVY